MLKAEEAVHTPPVPVTPAVCLLHNWQALNSRYPIHTDGISFSHGALTAGLATRELHEGLVKNPP